MNRSYARGLTLAVACTFLASCGGGSTVTPGASVGTPSKSASASTTFVVKVPARASISTSTASKRPAYITSNVKAIDFNVSQAANPTVTAYAFYPLTAQSSYCTSSSSGLTCTLAVNAPPGDDTFTVNLYDETEPGQGYVVATGFVTASISSSQANSINITTDGIPTFAVMGANLPYLVAGYAGGTPIGIQVTDPDGNVIVGSFDMPLTLSDSDTSGATSLSKTTLNQTSDESGINLSYTGTGTPTATITLTSTSPTLAGRANPQLASTTVTASGIGPAIDPPVLYFAHANSAAQTINVQEAGFGSATGPYTVDAGGCSTTYPTTETFVTVSGTSPTFTVTPVTSTFPTTTPSAYTTMGSCQLVVTDASHNSTFVPVMVGQ